MHRFLPAMLLATMAVTVLPLSVQAAECTKVVISADSDYAPLHWYDGKRLTGASIEIATRALSALNIPYEVFLMLPFVMTILAMALVSRNANAPASLLIPFRKEER